MNGVYAVNTITLNANAKINLFLDVTGKRADGYHLLETVMHTVSLHDTVTVRKTDNGITVSCTDSSIPCNEKNIAYKCADAFLKKNGISDCGISIHIEKNIPSQAGMGGGSADGAAVLKAMNMLFGTEMTEDELCSLALPLGADIPFCIKGGCGYCTGIGEIIEPLPVLSGCILIGKGTQGISTADAFTKIDALEKSYYDNNIKQIFSDVRSFSNIAPYCRNVFDEVTALDEVSKIKQIMQNNGAVCASMTGSGSAVFGLYDDIIKANETADMLKKIGFFSDVCSFI